MPDLEPRREIKITDIGPHDEEELTQRRWSWPEPNKRFLDDFGSEGGAFTSNRRLIIAAGFYHFAPKDPASTGRARTW